MVFSSAFAADPFQNILVAYFFDCLSKLGPSQLSGASLTILGLIDVRLIMNFGFSIARCSYTLLNGIGEDQN